MVLNKRQEQTVELVKAEQRASVKRIAQHFFVSEMTVRRDLKILEENGYLKRYNGGAVYNKEFDHLPIESRKLLNTAEKRKLCELARRYLRDNCSVFIDSSSTCLNLVPMLADFKGITLITNSVQCLPAVGKYHLKCIVAGGDYHEYDRCTVGVETVEFVRRFNVDVAFFSSGCISDDGIISDSDAPQTAVRRAVLQNSKKTVVLLERTKQHQKLLYTLCRRVEVDEIIMLSSEEEL